MAVVAMHHLVAAHQHRDSDEFRPMPDAGLLATVVDSRVPAFTPLRSADDTRPHGTPVDVAKLHVHPDPASDGQDGTGGTVLLALTLAVIAAAVAVVLTLVLVFVAASVLSLPQGSRNRVRRGAARPPPHALRLAQLQVLRV